MEDGLEIRPVVGGDLEPVERVHDRRQDRREQAASYSRVASTARAAFHSSLLAVGMSSSFTSGFPSRATCTHDRRTWPS